MDIEALQKSAIMLQKYQEDEITIKSLRKELESKNTYIETLEAKIKALVSNTQVTTYISTLESTIKTLQQKIEALQIVRPKQQKAEESILMLSDKKSEEFPNEKLTKFDQLLSNTKIWKNLQGFLIENDLFKLVLLSDSLKDTLLEEYNFRSKAVDSEKESKAENFPKKEVFHGLLKK